MWRGARHRVLGLNTQAWSIKEKRINWASPVKNHCFIGWPSEVDEKQMNKTIASLTSDQKTTQRTYREPSKVSIKNPNNPIRKWVKDMNRYFTEVGTQMANKHMKRCPASLVNWQIWIETTVRPPCTYQKGLKKNDNIECWRGCR